MLRCSRSLASRLWHFAQCSTTINPAARVLPEACLASWATAAAAVRDAGGVEFRDGVHKGWPLWSLLLPLASVQATSISKADAPEPETNHPLDYDPVTNEHTARMTLARRAAMDAYNQGRYKEAERRFKEAVDAAKQGFGHTDPHVASCLNNLAEFYKNSKDYDKAEPAYQQALELLYEQYGDTHWLYVSALHNLALMYAAKGELGAAQTTLEGVIKLRERMFGSKHITYADSEVALAGVLLKNGRRADAQRAVKLIQHAVFVLEDSGNVEGTPILAWLADLSKVLAQQKRYPEAAQYLRKTLQYLSSTHGELQAQASEIAEQLVTVLLESGEVAAAREIMQQSTEARMQLYGRDLTVARSLANLAALWLRSDVEGELVVAEHFASSAVSICQDLYQAVQRKGVMQLFGVRQDPTRVLSRLQVATELSSALSLQASAFSRLKQPAGAVCALRQACSCLQQQLQEVQQVVDNAGGTVDQEVVERLVTKYVEAKLQLLELLEKLTGELRQLAGSSVEEVQSIQQQASALAQELLGT